MKIECPHCLKISKLPEDLLLTRREGLEFQCSKCKSPIKIYLQPKSKKDNSFQASFDVFSDPIESFGLTAFDMEKQAGVGSLKSKILRSLIELPPMPHIILKAREVMEDPDSSLKDLTSVIETDQAIVARVLTLANSAYYGISGMVSSIQHASVLLGQKTLKEVESL
jgi:hypothetical protein